MLMAALLHGAAASITFIQWDHAITLEPAAPIPVILIIEPRLPEVKSAQAIAVEPVSAPRPTSASEREPTPSPTPPNEEAAASASGNIDEMAGAREEPSPSNIDSDGRDKNGDRSSTTDTDSTPKSVSTTALATAPGKKAKKTRQARSAEPVAVYDVVIDAAGNIQSVALAHSSGVRSFDEAGRNMIYHGIGLPRSPDEATALKVTLHFTRDNQ